MNLKTKQNKYFIFSLSVAVAVGLFASVNYVLADWTAPTTTPPACPSSNPACLSPINVGASTNSAQYINGALGIGGFFEAYSNVGIGTAPDSSQALSIYNGNIDLKRVQGNSTPAGLGPQIIFESPSSAAVMIETTTWSACNGASPQPACSPDTTPSRDNLNPYNACVSTDAGRAYNDVGYVTVPNNQYWQRTVNCIAGTSKYSVGTNNGTLQFLNNSGSTTVEIAQNGNVSSTGFCLGGTCQTSWNGFWVANGSNVYYNTYGGNVGIGTNNPTSTLTVAGEIKTTGFNGGVRFPDGSLQTKAYLGSASAVTSVTAGNGLSGGTITATGTLSLNLGNANTWTAAQTFPSIIDSGLLNQNCVGTDASGKLQTGTCGGSGGTNQWATSTSGIYYNSGSVGIGTTNASYALQVSGSIGVQGVPSDPESSAIILGSGNSDNYGGFVICGSGSLSSCSTDTFDNRTSVPDYTATPNVLAGVCSASQNGTYNDVGKSYIANTNTVIYLQRTVVCYNNAAPLYKVNNLDGTLKFSNNAGTPKMVIGQDGHVGIGTLAPAQELTVSGGSLLFSGNANQFTYNDTKDTNNNTSFYFQSTAPAANTNIIATGNSAATGGTLTAVYGNNWTNNNIEISHNGTNGIITTGAGALILSPASGNVGIGTTSASAPLYVKRPYTANSAVATFFDASSSFLSVIPQLGSGGYNPLSSSGDFGFIFGNTGGNDIAPGNILTIAPWSTAKSGIRISSTTTAIYGNVGIGTTNPSAKLYVSGGGYGSGGGGANNSAYALGADSMAAGVSIYSYGSICAGNSQGNCTGTGGVTISSTSTVGIPKVAISGSGNSYFNAGNVGIGTPTPNASLQVLGNVMISSVGGFNNALYLGGNSDSYGTWDISKLTATKPDPSLDTTPDHDIGNPPPSTDTGVYQCGATTVGTFTDWAWGSYIDPSNVTHSGYVPRIVTCVYPDEPLYKISNRLGTLTFSNNLGTSEMTLDQSGNVIVNNGLTVAGEIKTTTGGVRFPDNSLQTTANGQEQLFSTPGDGNFIVPPGVTKVFVTMSGGGGGGGGGGSGGGGGGGGASGDIAIRIPVSGLSPGQNIKITVGAGGAGGAGGGGSQGNDGKIGLSSMFGTLLTVSGGSAGLSGGNGNGGKGGSPSDSSFGGSGDQCGTGDYGYCGHGGGDAGGGGGDGYGDQYHGDFYCPWSFWGDGGGGGGGGGSIIGGLGGLNGAPTSCDQNNSDSIGRNGIMGGGGGGGAGYHSYGANGGNGGSGFVLVEW